MIVGGVNYRRRHWIFSPIEVATVLIKTPTAPTATVPVYSNTPQVQPAQGDPIPDTGGIYPSWVKSGGTLLPYAVTTHTPGFMAPVLGPPALHRFAPFNPLLMMGFAVNLLLLAGEVLIPPEHPRFDAV